MTRSPWRRVAWTLLVLPACVYAQSAGADATEPARESQSERPDVETAPEVTVIFNDSQQVTGLRVDVTEDTVVLWINGISVHYPLSSIARIHVHEPVMERYQSMRSKIGDNSQQILQLARWLRDRERFDLAIEEVERAVQLDRDNAEARQLLTELRAQRLLRNKSGKENAGKPRVDRPSRRRVKRPEFPYLTDEQIDLIRVYEVHLGDPPRMLIPRATIDKLFEQHAGSSLIPTSKEARDAIYRWTPVRVLELMFQLRARDLYNEVQIIDELESMATFRDQVNRGWLINRCATDRCHGGRQAGRFWLSNQQPNSVASVYTNYLVLERSRVIRGVEGADQEGEGIPLLNFADPEDSALLQLALPREDSAVPHPEVPHEVSGRDTWKPVFRSKRDRRFRQVTRWIESMYHPHPEYPIDFEPPTPPPLVPAGVGTGDADPDEAEPQPRE